MHMNPWQRPPTTAAFHRHLMLATSLSGCYLVTDGEKSTDYGTYTAPGTSTTVYPGTVPPDDTSYFPAGTWTNPTSDSGAAGETGAATADTGAATGDTGADPGEATGGTGGATTR
jgi:hypothetical protein